MADENDIKEQSKEVDTKAATVANLSVPTIIAALHENAVRKSNAQSKGMNILNSAIDNDSGKASLTSAGEHIISVVPLEKDGIIQKKDAIDIIKQYVQWFVGPDLASKVSDSTVKSLLESPENKDAQKNESVKVVSFKHFLLEEETKDAESSIDSEETKTSEENARGEEKTADAPDSKTDNSSDSESKEEDKSKEKDEEIDEKTRSKTGYYIPYNLKVEGLKQTALKDAMKKFAKTLFDTTTITAHGIFGSGDSFTVKDVKDALNDAFGPIDPDDLVEAIGKEIKTKHPNKNDGAKVDIRDKTTLIAELDKDNAIDASQKQKINSADYSLYISVTEPNGDKPIFNPRIIADIVQSSIKGLFKKFKNKVTKNDVVYVQNYISDTAKNKIAKQVTGVPEYVALKNIVSKYNNEPQTAFDKIDKQFDSIIKDSKKYENNNYVKKCVAVWQQFCKKNKDAITKLADNKEGVKSSKFFKDFLAQYEKAFNAKDKPEISLNESISILKTISTKDMFTSFVLESLYGATQNAAQKSINNRIDSTKDSLKNDIMAILFEKDDETNGNESSQEDAFTEEDIQNITSAFRNKLVDIGKDTTTLSIKPIAKVGTSQDVIAWLDERGLSSSELKDKASNFKYMAAHVLKIPIKVDDTGKLGKGSLGFNAYTDENVLQAIESIINEKIDEPVLSYEATANNKIMYHGTKTPANCKIRAIFFNGQAKEQDILDDSSKDEKPEEKTSTEQTPTKDNSLTETTEETPKTNSDGESTQNISSARTDLYVIPMPGLKYKDKEYNTYA